MNVRQLLFRPTRSLYCTLRSGRYLCGASTPSKFPSCRRMTDYTEVTLLLKSASRVNSCLPTIHQETISKKPVFRFP